MKTFKPHPAAELFPMIPAAELDALAEDIKAHGQHHPAIITRAGLLLDGRNRQEACKRAGVALDAVMWMGEEDGASPTAYVLSANLNRRHLTDSQKAMVAVDALPLFKAEAKARQKASGGDRRSVSAPVREPIATSRAKAGKGKSAEAAAKAIGVSARIVEQAKALVERAPKAELEKIRSGEKTVKQVERETKRATQVAQVRVYQPPAGEFAVIVADPPWQYSDQLDGSDASRGGCPYPTMPLEDICALKPPAARDCILWLWTTNAFIADGSAARVVREWGFTSKTVLTWVKPRMGLGRWLRNITEHCILAVRGDPRVDLSNETTMFCAPVGEHSAKPDHFYKLIEKLCPSPARIEMFARADRPGWVSTGPELPKKAPTRDWTKAVETEKPEPEPAPKPRKRKLVVGDFDEVVA